MSKLATKSRLIRLALIYLFSAILAGCQSASVGDVYYEEESNNQHEEDDGHTEPVEDRIIRVGQDNQ